jgi:tetratricopeptide (TPR) repeat protein
LEDLAPTIREWFSVGETKQCDGESLFSRGGAERILPSLTLQPAIEFSVNPCMGIRKGGMMYIKHGVEELYDLATDPGETRDLSGDRTHGKEFWELRKTCDNIFQAAVMQTIAKPTLTQSAKELDALKGLGYIGGSMPAISQLQRADIRVVCEDYARFERIRQAYTPGQDPAQLREAYEAILSKYPRAMPYQKNLGILLLQNGDMEGAFHAFDQAARLNPRDPAVLVNLGGLYLVQGKVAAAKQLLDAALALDENNAMAHKNLGIIYAQYLKDPAKAVEHYKRYLALGGGADAKQVQEYIRGVEGPR